MEAPRPDMTVALPSGFNLSLVQSRRRRGSQRSLECSFRHSPSFASQSRTRRLLDNDAACLDRSSPLLGLALDERSKIFGCGTVCGGNLRAEAAQSFANGRRFHCLNGSVVELLDDFSGRVLRKEEGVPGISLKTL